MNKQFETAVVHAGMEPDPTTGAINPPVYFTSTYQQSAPGEHLGFEYSRSQNPTRFAFERAVAQLEGGSAGFAFASGMAAIGTLFECLSPGDHIIASHDLYGGTYRLLENVRSRSAGLSTSFVDFSDLAALEAALTPKTKLLWVETPTNPLMQLADLSALATFAKAHGLIAVADNTFASPYLQQPLSHGFDVVMHSTTKYLNGHCDVVGGLLVVGSNRELAEQIGYLQNAVGAIAGPMDSYLALRGLKTLALRLSRQSESAHVIAQLLQSHQAIEKVYYPGLPSHPQHELAKRQMRAFGGMVSFTVRGGLSGAKVFLSRLSLITLAESLGGVESLINHPALMTHGSIPKALREARGITDGLLRLSVGIEHINDLLEEVRLALEGL